MAPADWFTPARTFVIACERCRERIDVQVQLSLLCSDCNDDLHQLAQADALDPDASAG